MKKKQFIFKKSRPFFMIDFLREHQEAKIGIYGLSDF